MIHLKNKTEVPEGSPPDFDTVVNQLGIVGDHHIMKEALEIEATLAPSMAPILILGETGMGKFYREFSLGFNWENKLG